MVIEKYIIDKSDLTKLLKGEDLLIRPTGNIKGLCMDITGNPTNGDIIKLLFSNGKEYDTINDGCIRFEIEIDFDYSYCSYFDEVWWNEPYIRERK